MINSVLISIDYFNEERYLSHTKLILMMKKIIEDFKSMKMAKAQL